MNDKLMKMELFLVKVTCIQFVFLLIAQCLLSRKEIAPFICKTIFYEGVYLEGFFKVVEILDRIPSL